MTSSATLPVQEQIVLAGGCFWCLDAVFAALRGVVAVESGYANGHVVRPSYEEVCTGQTGHAEVVKITYDPSVVTLADLLAVFFQIHDPTTRNAQGHDVGPQYRSGIYTTTPEQASVAHQVIDQLRAQGVWDKPIVTEVAPLHNYWPAEESHQNFFARNPNQPYCLAVVAPKVAKLRRHFSRLLQPGHA